MTTRRATVAGRFYPDNPVLLKRMMDRFYVDPKLVSFLSTRQEKGAHNTSYGIVSAHAGIVYSGLTSAYSYSTISPDFDGTFVVIGPSHNGYPDCISAASWETPLGEVESDDTLVEALSQSFCVDEGIMSAQENSIELQMLFIRHRFKNAKCLAILMGDQSYDNAIRVGNEIYNALKDTKSSTIIVASSDFSHYISAERAEKYDRYAISALYDLDSFEFYERIRKHRISACGYGPITAMVQCSKEEGGKFAELLNYSTSGDITSDYSEVVGYAAISVE